MLLFVSLRLAAAQLPAIPAGNAGTVQARVTVRISCDVCDLEQLQAALPFVTHVTEADATEVEVEIRTKPSLPDGGGLVSITGHGRFEGQRRQIPLPPLVTGSEAEARAALVRIVKLGVTEYVASSAEGSHLSVSFNRPQVGGASPIQENQRDPWHYWVFRLGANTFLGGEQSTSDASYSVSGSANRVTERWKVRLSAYRNLSTNSFTLEDGETIESRLSDWTVDGLIVRSLGPRWSVGLTGALVGSTYSNSRRVARLAPGIEFDLFPYAESSRRSLTLQYTIGGARYDYEAETIFGFLEEAVAQHTVNVSLGLRQPWGQAGASFVFTQQLQASDRTRTTLNGNMNIRIVKSLTLNTSASYSRIRDLFTLQKGDATDEDVFLRQRQLATGYRYSFSVGFGYSFGALSNTTVNPRFGG